MQKLEDLIPGEKVTSIDPSDAIIFYGHALIQILLLPGGMEKVTFRDRALNILSQMHGSGIVQQIHVVFDRYNVDSIKNTTREKCSAGTHAQKYHVQLGGEVPKTWKVFLSQGENKSNLAKSYIEYMEECGGAQLHETKSSMSVEVKQRRL